MPVWFEQKTGGWGAGLPVAPEGWALLAVYGVGLAGLGLTYWPDRPVQFLVGKTIITVALIAAVAKTTRGGFRWRWGGEP